MKRVIEQCTDDVTGEDGAQPHILQVDNERIEIDLTEESYAGLMAALAPYLDAGRRVRPDRAGQPYRIPPPRRTTLPDAISPADLRRWWKANLGALPDLPAYSSHGRVPAKVFEAWQRSRPAAGSDHAGR